MRRMTKLAVIGVTPTTLGLGLDMPAAFADGPPTLTNPHGNSQGNCNGVYSSASIHNGQTVKEQAQQPDMCGCGRSATPGCVFWRSLSYGVWPPRAPWGRW